MSEQVWLWLAFLLPLLSIPLERNLSPGLGHRCLHPLRWLAKQIADKVVHSDNGPKQQRMAGFLALTILLVPALLTLAILHWLFPATSLLDGVLLLFLLQWQAPMQRFQQVSARLADHHQARFLLSPWLLRDCDNLSKVGVAKANTEMLVLRLAASWFAVLFWFFIGGIVMAVLYRLTLELHFAWNSKIYRYQQFGKAASKLYQTLSWLPFQLLSYLVALFSKKEKTQPALAQGFRWPYSASGTLLSVMAAKLELELGGPRSYEDKRHEYAYFGPRKRYPDQQQLAKLVRLMNIMAWLFVAALLPVYALRHVFL